LIVFATGGTVKVYDHTCKVLDEEAFPFLGKRMGANHLPYAVVITRISIGFRDVQKPDMTFEFLYAGASYGSGKSLSVIGKVDGFPYMLYNRVGFLCRP
jgi:hypothetical protein